MTQDGAVADDYDTPEEDASIKINVSAYYIKGMNFSSIQSLFKLADGIEVETSGNRVKVPNALVYCYKDATITEKPAGCSADSKLLWNKSEINAVINNATMEEVTV